MNPASLLTLQQHLLTALTPAPNETRRLFHGRGRCWPGLEQITADWLQGVLLITLFKPVTDEELAALRSMLLELTDSDIWRDSQAHSLILQLRYLPDSPSEWLLGEPKEQWDICEHGLHYRLDLGRKQNTGLFLDMRLGRQWVQQQSACKRVLNLFAYTCGFSIAAIAGGAQQVINLDMAKSALARGRDNHRLNNHDLSKVSFLGHDLFNSWGKLRKSGPYDLIIIDPPSFQRGSFVLSKDYPKVLRRLPELLSENGIVLACCNDPEIGPDYLINAMNEQAPQLKFIERLENPPEFPDSNPDSALKTLVFQG
ncbi:class I SAM-dependent methyltransferase [Pseudomonas sp. TTU2014-080ASC]|uniref:class I SAM-dependent methyltransferase n=1 Tax=Pseudomonas sp. TTU2014-080ASC TaxID=1729724 RepID=UPI0007188B1A|nr:class I SAM-dependent methyltransferase [Pseudomonas sp. TTU2014-080ASC]KRW61340.1 methyltransferase [Pseudomonas sp. TTU2014-080ASC]